MALTPAQQAQVDDVVGSMMATPYGYIDLIRQRPDNDYAPGIVRELIDTTEGLAILDSDQATPQYTLDYLSAFDSKRAQSNFTDVLYDFGVQVTKDMLKDFKRVIKVA